MATALETPPSQANVSHYSPSPHHLKPPTALSLFNTILSQDLISSPLK